MRALPVQLDPPPLLLPPRPLLCWQLAQRHCCRSSTRHCCVLCSHLRLALWLLQVVAAGRQQWQRQQQHHRLQQQQQLVLEMLLMNATASCTKHWVLCHLSSSGDSSSGDSRMLRSLEMEILRRRKKTQRRCLLQHLGTTPHPSLGVLVLAQQQQQEDAAPSSNTRQAPHCNAMLPCRCWQQDSTALLLAVLVLLGGAPPQPQHSRKNRSSSWLVQVLQRRQGLPA